MQLNSFNGGLSTRLAPHLIAPNEAITCNNVDFTSGGISPARLPVSYAKSIQYSFYGWRGKWLSSDAKRDYLEYRNSLLWTEKGRSAKKFDGTNTYNLGIKAPTSKLNISANTTSGSSAVDIVANTLNNITSATFTVATSGNLNAGLYQYKIVHKAPNGVTSAANIIEYNLNSGLAAITISNMVGITGTVYVYRNYAGTYRLVGTTTSSITDAVLDISAHAALVEHTEFPLGETLQYLYETLSPEGNKVDYRTITLDNTKKTYAVVLAGADNYYRYYNGSYKQVNPIDDTYATTGADANKYLSGTYQYTYTYYNSVDGTESMPVDYSSELLVDNQTVKVQGMIASIDSQVDTIRLYRVGGNLTLPTLVTELPNANQIYYDSLEDTAVNGWLLDSFNNREAPIGLSYLTEAYAIFFGAEKDKLWFSEIGNPNYWPVYNFIDFDADITGIGVVANGVMVFTLYKTYIITGTSSNTFVKHLVSAEQGCVDHKSIRYADNSLIWASQDGLCTTTGGNIQVVTLSKLGKLKIQNVHNAVVHEQVYYISYDNKILALDFRFGVAYKEYTFDVDYIEKYNDELYGHYRGKLYKLFKGEPASWTYRTGDLTNQFLSMSKLYNDIYIAYKGEVTISAYIDDRLVTTVKLSGDKQSIADMPIPSQEQRGYKLAFELSGTGEVYEIEFKVLGRQNGK